MLSAPSEINAQLKNRTLVPLDIKCNWMIDIGAVIRVFQSINIILGIHKSPLPLTFAASSDIISGV